MASVFTIESLAERWGVSYQTVYALLRSGNLKGFQVGRAWRITSEAVTEYEGGISND